MVWQCITSFRGTKRPQKALGGSINIIKNATWRWCEPTCALLKNSDDTTRLASGSWQWKLVSRQCYFYIHIIAYHRSTECHTSRSNEKMQYVKNLLNTFSFCLMECSNKGLLCLSYLLHGTYVGIALQSCFLENCGAYEICSEQCDSDDFHGSLKLHLYKRSTL